MPTAHSASTAHLVPDAHPAHALLSVAHALLCPANTIAHPPPPDKEIADISILPIEEVTMPTEDFSDLKDVVDAINRLCDTMKSSNYEDEVYEDCTVEQFAYVECETELVSPEEVTVQRVEVHRAERWSECRTSEHHEDPALMTSDTEQAAAQCEPTSEMYYTASSEVSLISDVDLPERVHEDDKDEKECVIAGHVAAMRERFESMTRTNTPCPDLLRSASPSFDVFRNITPSPDRLD